MTALIQATGAVVMGRRTFAMAEDPDWFVGNYEFQVPIFVLTHQPPPVMPKQDEHLTFTFVTDGVASAIAKAKAAAGPRVVQVLGASVVQQVLRAGLADELHVDVAPVLLGAGLRLFDDPDLEVALEKVGVQEVGAITSLRLHSARPCPFLLLLLQAGHVASTPSTWARPSLPTKAVRVGRGGP